MKIRQKVLSGHWDPTQEEMNALQKVRGMNQTNSVTKDLETLNFFQRILKPFLEYKRQFFAKNDITKKPYK